MRPLTQFCCGCQITTGMYLILFVNFFANMFYMAMAVCNIILHVPTLGYNTALGVQTFNAAFCLLGLPFIIAAWYGVRYRVEVNVRLYFMYFLLSFALDMAFFLYFMFLTDSCSAMPGMPSVLKRQGHAFVCGFTRFAVILSCFSVGIIQGYCLYTVWSFAEDVRCGGAGGGLPDLLSQMDQKSYASGLYGTGYATQGPYPADYGSLHAPAVGGGSAIFEGQFHDTSFPPRNSPML